MWAVLIRLRSTGHSQLLQQGNQEEAYFVWVKQMSSFWSQRDGNPEACNLRLDHQAGAVPNAGCSLGIVKAFQGTVSHIGLFPTMAKTTETV
jgi:hypothetical protein